MLKISEAIKTTDDYSKLTDEIFAQISSSTADNLKEARDILNKIVRRKLPKFVGEARLTQKKFSKEELTKTWKTAVEKYKPTDPTVSLNAEDFSVYVVDLDHGMKDKNPIEKVYFYSKRKPNEASAIKDYQLSSFLPKRFNEELVRVYYKITDGNKEEDKKMEKAEKIFQICICKGNRFGLMQAGGGENRSDLPGRPDSVTISQTSISACELLSLLLIVSLFSFPLAFPNVLPRRGVTTS
ncbi:hypothetical protein QQF64_000295 [Cirrhinus molitorella]|uniref:Uncharacterized protein n=1 Tax=Cirrhinus molitorella TaxID=172907 RepID=A0ABR3NWS1_9TELE